MAELERRGAFDLARVIGTRAAEMLLLAGVVYGTVTGDIKDNRASVVRVEELIVRVSDKIDALGYDAALVRLGAVENEVALRRNIVLSVPSLEVRIRHLEDFAGRIGIGGVRSALNGDQN